MTVANATYETRAPFGVGDFSYSACSLSARALSNASDSFFLSGLPKSAARGRLKFKWPVDSRSAAHFSTSSTDGRDLLLPGLAVVSPDVAKNALCWSVAQHGFCGDAVSRVLDPSFTASVPLHDSVFDRNAFRVSLCDVVKHVAASVEDRLSRTGHVTISVEDFSSSGARFVCLPLDAGLLRSGGYIKVSGMLGAASWRFLPDSSAAFSVSAPWFNTHARYINTVYKACRHETRHCLGGGLVLPKFGRALRL